MGSEAVCGVMVVGVGSEAVCGVMVGKGPLPLGFSDDGSCLLKLLQPIIGIRHQP